MRNPLLCYLFLLTCLAACAKSAPPATTAGPEITSDAGPTLDAVPSAPPSSSAAAVAAPPPSEAGSAVSATGVPEPGSNDVDACAPAAVELEKSARVAMRTCYEDGAKKKPNLAGTVRIAVNVDARGKISSTKSIDKSSLGDKVVDCIQKAIKATPFDGGKCQMRTMTIVHAYPH